MNIEKLGFKITTGSVHSSRTIMLDELTQLFASVPDPEAKAEGYYSAIVDANCLGKRSGKTRMLTYRHLRDLYTLNPNMPVFRVFRYFWDKDPESHGLLALLCAYTRDDLLQRCAPFIVGYKEQQQITREALEAYITERMPDRFSPATLKSTAQNINSSFTKAGHLSGKAKKIRTKPAITTGTLAYALFLGYISGERGDNLFRSEYIRLIDCTYDRAIEMAEQASIRGWLVLKRIGNVAEVLFPNLLSEQEISWINE